MSELTFKIPATDWLNDIRREEDDPIKSEDDMLGKIDEGRSTTQVAKHYLVTREMGWSPDDLIPGNKLLLLNGAREGVSSVIKRQKRTVEIGDKEYEVRAYVGEPTSGQGSKDNGQPTNFVQSDNPEAMPRLENYLLKRIPGHIWSRLVLAKGIGGDVRGLGDELIGIINGQVNRLTE